MLAKIAKDCCVANDERPLNLHVGKLHSILCFQDKESVAYSMELSQMPCWFVNRVWCSGVVRNHLLQPELILAFDAM